MSGLTPFKGMEINAGACFWVFVALIHIVFLPLLLKQKNFKLK